MAKTNKGREVYVCETAQASDLDLAAFVALTWVLVSNVGAIGESGASTNLPSYDEFDTDVLQKGKGITDAGTTTIEVSTNMTDVGQVALRTAALTQNDFAISWVDDDGVTHYQRGKITGPTAPNGRNEDFRRQVFTMGWNQREVIATAADIVAPVNSLVPSMAAAQTLDISDATVVTGLFGTWTGHPTSYVWQFEKDVAGNGVFSAIGGASGTWTAGTAQPTYTIVAGTGATNRVRFGVKGVNAAGTTAAFSYSTPSIPVIA
jgi:hypothetical protein